MTTTQHPPKPRGRPELPPERRKGVTLRARVTDAQAAEWERRGGPEWLRKSLSGARS